MHEALGLSVRICTKENLVLPVRESYTYGEWYLCFCHEDQVTSFTTCQIQIGPQVLLPATTPLPSQTHL